MSKQYKLVRCNINGKDVEQMRGRPRLADGHAAQ